MEKEDWKVDPNNVISFVKTDTGLLKGYLGMNELSEQEAKNLQQEARTLEQFRIWDVFQETLRQEAINRAVMSSKNFEEVLAGKMMVHNLGVMKAVLENILKLS